jgi:NAD(P)-dependent dehydrogenase (short-subunit alcohol dehydrogenase family)
MSSSWTVESAPRQYGKTIVITGANSGIGFEAARALAQTGAKIVLACRNTEAANDAAAKIKSEHPNAELEVSALDLASLDSVRHFADRYRASHAKLDVLINNAGVMALPYRKTADGFEMQFGTNHLGHFALTGLLLPVLEKAEEARVVTVSSLMHAVGSLRWDDLQRERGYVRWLAYAQSKLANLLYAYELDRRVRAKGLSLRSVACHPGYASTNLQSGAARMTGSSFGARMWGLTNGLFAQSGEKGALPTEFAAIAQEAEGGDFIGPSHIFELFGPPKRTKSSRAKDAESGARLWAVSEELTQTRYLSS